MELRTGAEVASQMLCTLETPRAITARVVRSVHVVLGYFRGYLFWSYTILEVLCVGGCWRQSFLFEGLLHNRWSRT